MAKKKSAKKQAKGLTESYQHRETKAVARPDVGTQSQFKKKKPPVTYRYDSSLAPELSWDGQNPAREEGERWIAEVLEASAELNQLTAQLHGELDADASSQLSGQLQAVQTRLQSAAERLRRLGEPFLNWAGKAERLSFDVMTLPLFVHERLSTEAIIETLTGHKRKQPGGDQLSFDFFADPQHSIVDQVLKSYEYQDDWVNRMILGDAMVVMNSLVHYEGLGGQVQMIYMDPPYGVKFGSNFQPFVRRRDVKHNDDEDLTREPEMVQAYRDTWELGLHSYLTYLRDRLLVARELLAPSGSLFVQISDENLHHVREVVDEVFGAENFCSQIVFRKTTGKGGQRLDNTYDVLLWYAKEMERVKFRALYERRTVQDDENLRFVELKDGSRRKLKAEEVSGAVALPPASKVFRPNPLTNQRPAQGADLREFKFEGRVFTPGTGTFRTDAAGMERLAAAQRLMAVGNTLTMIRYLEDFPYKPRNDIWDDTRQSGFGESKIYVVQTATRAIERCLLMTTDPGDLVLDPTCGSGTTAYVAEQWGRRWITIDVSRVPLALARQRLLTATFPWYELADEPRGPAGGFVYKRKQNRKGEEVGGIVPHVTLKSIANNEPAKEEVLVDRPEQEKKVTRVAGPFCVEATIPTPVDLDGDGQAAALTSHAVEHSNFEERMIEILRRSPILRLSRNRTVELHNLRKPAKTLSLSAEAVVDAEPHGARRGSPDPAETADRRSPAASGDLRSEQVARSETGHSATPLSRQPVGFVFGPENGAVSEKLVFEAAREASAKSYTHLYVIGFAIQPKAREFIEHADSIAGIPATYVQATPDLMMGDLLKNMRSSQIFSVCGLPDVKLHRNGGKKSPKLQVELLGMDVFDPTTLDVDNRPGSDVPAWLLDTDYNDLCFHVCQAFFPRTRAWDSIRKALKGTHDDSVWDHLAGTISAPFEPGEHNKIAVKVIDDRGNELMVVKDLNEGKSK